MDNPEERQPEAEGQAEAPGTVFVSERLEEERPAEAATGGEEPRPSGFQRLLHALFSPETRLGRFMRPLLRTLALFVGAFALGLLAAYLLLYRPAGQELQAARAELAAAQQQLSGSQATLATSESSVAAMNSQVKRLEENVHNAQTRVHLLLLAKEVKSAQLSLAAKDGAAAQKSLESAGQELNAVLPALQELDASRAEGVKLRLDLATSELARDPQTAQKDLEILNADLAQLDETLAGRFD